MQKLFFSLHSAKTKNKKKIGFNKAIHEIQFFENLHDNFLHV